MSEIFPQRGQKITEYFQL